MPITRRTFVASGLTALGGLFVHSLHGQYTDAPLGRPKRVAIVGLGERGMEIAAILARSDLGAAIAGCDLDPARIQKAQIGGASFITAGIFETAHVLYSHFSPDVVCIATPDHTHLTLIAEALQRGVRVVIDPPLALNFAELTQLQGTRCFATNLGMIDAHRSELEAKIGQVTNARRRPDRVVIECRQWRVRHAGTDTQNETDRDACPANLSWRDNPGCTNGALAGDGLGALVFAVRAMRVRQIRRIDIEIARSLTDPFQSFSSGAFPRLPDHVDAQILFDDGARITWRQRTFLSHLSVAPQYRYESYRCGGLDRVACYRLPRFEVRSVVPMCGAAMDASLLASEVARLVRETVEAPDMRGNRNMLQLI